MQLGAAVAMDGQMGKIAQVGNVTLEEQLIVTQMRVRDAADHENCLSTRFEIHKIQVQDGKYFLHDHVPRDQN